MTYKLFETFQIASGENTAGLSPTWHSAPLKLPARGAPPLPHRAKRQAVLIPVASALQMDVYDCYRCL